jgi:RNA polymerase sigma-70 factor (ECF subfamily)
MPPTSQTSRPDQAKTPQPAGADSHAAPTAADLGELVAAAQAGSGEALERLLATARPKLLALAMRVLGNADEAEDAVQDAMVKVWRNLKRFEGRAQFSTWLHRIAVNAALDRLRRRGGVHVSTGAQPDEQLQDAAEAVLPETPERIYARAETAVVVRGAMARLSPTHGEALRLCDLEGESYATIATVTACPLGTVMSRLFHARRKLARELTDTTTGDGDLEALRAA